MMSDFHTIEPCEALKPYVSCYYFIKSDDPKFSSRHYSFPHTYNALSIYKDVLIEKKPSSVSIFESATPNYEMFIQIKKQAPLMVKISGKINRATILFKDLSINHFVSDSLAKVMNDDEGRFNTWKQSPLYPNFIAQLFDTDDEVKKGKLIDQFLLAIFSPIQASYLADAVALLCDFEESLPIDQIAAQFNVSLRTFNRNFKAVLGVSPVEYRRIAQFRHSLGNKLFQSQLKRLTAIGYESHFYDQSYFNKIYHKLTGSNPKKFFESIDRIGDDKLIFQFVKK
jgi:AraC-like DNA-binding protein